MSDNELLIGGAKVTDTESSSGERRILALLAELGGKQVADDDLVFEGKKFIIPARMTLRSAKKFIEKRIQQEEEETSFSRTFKYRPWDGAHAMQSALKKGFGTAGLGQAIHTMFGKIPPQLITIETGVDEQQQVPWGRVEFPPIEGYLDLGSEQDKELGLLFRLSVTAPRKYRAEIEGLFKLVEEELKTNSIYRGKAITGAEQPTFIDPFSVDERKVVYNEDVRGQLHANIWGLLEYTETMRKHDVPLKRSVLLSGPYGTGKSLAAMLTAQRAVRNGWTFLFCRPQRDNLAQVMQTAQLYQPAVVFYEDVDTLASSGEPDKVQELLDLFDGIQVKGTELVVVLTTNHVEKIHKGMIRPGRLDAVITIEALDHHSVEALIRNSVDAKLLTEEIDFDRVGEAMRGFLPAFIKESIDRAMRYAIVRENGTPTKLTTEDFVYAAEGLRPQLDLMEGAGEGATPDALSQAFRRVIKEQVVETIGTVQVIDTDDFAEYRLQPADEQA